MRHKKLLDRDNAALLIIDVQERFRPHTFEVDRLISNIQKMLSGAAVFKLPVLITEQYPRGLGPTVPEILEAAGEYSLFEKDCFSCYGAGDFRQAVEESGRKQIIVCGIEAHVCVNQTVHDLIQSDYSPHLVSDAISSRHPHNKEVGIQKMMAAGAVLSSVETALFEMLVSSGTAEFKAVQSLVK